ncbi:MAG: bifunctional riboflavin kinase/FAD synthetase [Thermodesulfovibrionales bacterium]
MEILNGIEAVRERHRGAVVTIGNFDGVHMGHQKIIAAVTQAAGAAGARSLAITFDPHPVKVLAPERGLSILTPADEKAALMAHYGLDAVLFINFSREFARIPADDFIRDVLVGRLGARQVIVGHGYAFGRGKKGTTELLRRRGRRLGFGVKVVRNARIHGDVVSSSRIRGLLSRGKVSEAAALLGRPYMIKGEVIRGAGRGGRLLGTPTANISTPYELVPREGVYAIKARFDGKAWDGVASIGTNPTFGNSRVSYEAHLFGFSGDLVGKTLKVYFVERIRDERRFSDAEGLKAQILEDIARAREALRARPGLTLI